MSGPLPQDDRFALCGPERELPAPPQATKDHKPGTTEISADEAELEKEGTSTLTGNVGLVRDDKAARADHATYNKKTETVHAHGHARYWDPRIFWWGERARIYLEKDESRFEQGKYRLGGEKRGHGKADLIKHDDRKKVTRLSNVDYTTCEGHHPDWRLEAKRMKLDHEAEWGGATHVFLNVKDFPVLYVPYLTFPLSDKRKTGFLPPRIGSSSETGFDLTTPFYWNIAPEHDATFAPRIMGKRGVMLGGQGRYLFTTGQGQLDFEYMPEDRLFDDQRHFTAFNHQQSFAKGQGHLLLNYNEVSDREYFEDFGGNLTTSSTRVLPQTADIGYGDHLFGLSWNILGRVEKYDVADKSLDVSPYERLPQVVFGAQTPSGNFKPNFQFSAETVHFDRDQGIVGWRYDLQPTLSFPIYTPSAFLISRLSLRHTQYDLDEGGADPANLTPDNPSRTLPILSMDSGLFFERDFGMGESAYIQTLEPRLFYLYIPDSTEQNDFPLFDTSEYDVSFFQLFRENRFSGADRVGDANQATLALSSRLIDGETGVEHLRLSIGQLVNFEDRDVVLQRQPFDSRVSADCVPQGPKFSCIVSDTDTLSETVGEVAARLAKAWSARVNLTWDPNEGRVEKGTVGLRYWPDLYTIVNAEYRFRRDITTTDPTATVFREGAPLTDVDQADISFRWPLNPNWSILGRWNYSFDTEETLEAVGGVGYNSCCWAVQAVARRFINTSTGEFDNAFYLQLELKGLAGIGKTTTSFLKKTIPGYQDDF